jgi:hypothetical protein
MSIHRTGQTHQNNGRIIDEENNARHLLFLRDMHSLTASMGNDIVSPAQPSSPSHLAINKEE